MKAMPLVRPMEGLNFRTTLARPAGGVRFWWMVSLMLMLMLMPILMGSVSGVQVRTMQYCLGMKVVLIIS